LNIGRKGIDLSIYLRIFIAKNASLFLNLSHACPEPVLINIRVVFLKYKMARKSAFFRTRHDDVIRQRALWIPELFKRLATAPVQDIEMDQHDAACWTVNHAGTHGQSAIADRQIAGSF
jgi:hypothetical protein